ncbi:MAG: ribonuclease H-like domain-containing protein [Lachnospiraceae bacterium]|nr:ribonuclease H-like domain-containing protein [Lachnospiraceae bacterium]
MITIQHPVDLENTYPLDRIGPLDHLLFFDIETTGFSGDTSSLYLIGCTYYEKETASWNMIQWFADTPDSEPELLTAFFTFLKNYTTLVHFNGDMFDIPYLLKRCGHLGLPFDFSGIASVDIYRKIRPYKRLLGLDSLKQKAIEQFLGISRKDMYSGGQLIEVYKDYLMTHEAFLYDMLILHNEDDLKGMPLILPILNYPDMLEGEWKLTGQSIRASVQQSGGPFPEDFPVLELVFESPFSIPVPFQTAVPLSPSSDIRLLAEGRFVTCLLPLYEGELKYFYPNYKDYYYLPCEDTAVHKSVGEYVAKEARKKATARTCYTKKSGLFVPQTESLFQPAFRQELKDKITYAVYEEALFSDAPKAAAYLHALFSAASGCR